MFIRRPVVDIIHKCMSISSIRMFKIPAANRPDRLRCHLGSTNSPSSGALGISFQEVEIPGSWNKAYSLLDNLVDKQEQVSWIKPPWIISNGLGVSFLILARIGAQATPEY